MFYGTIHNAGKMMQMTQKWEQKKDSGNILQKDASPLTAEERQLERLKEQAESNREASKLSGIYNKIMTGEELTPQEEEELRGHDPKMYMEYKADLMKRKAYEEKLKNCRTKEEVEKVHAEKIQGNFSRLQSVMNDPHITKEEKLKVARRMQGDTLASARILSEYKQTKEYADLPTEEEVKETHKAEAEAKEAPETEQVVVQPDADDNVEAAGRPEVGGNAEATGKPETGSKTGTDGDTETIAEAEVRAKVKNAVRPKRKSPGISAADMRVIMQIQEITAAEIGTDTGFNLDIKA